MVSLHQPTRYDKDSSRSDQQMAGENSNPQLLETTSVFRVECGQSWSQLKEKYQKNRKLSIKQQRKQTYILGFKQGPTLL